MAETASKSVDFHLITLGVPRLDIIDHATGSTRTVGPGKSLALITYLAFAPRRTVARDTLCDLLWGDRSVEQSRPLLRQTLWLIKTQICADILSAKAENVSLVPPVSCDTEKFTQAVEADDLRLATSLYNGDFFSGYAAPGAGRFEEWANLERTRFRGLFMHAAESLARKSLDSGKFLDAIALANRMRRADPNAQAGWRLLLEARVASGDRIAARADADQFEEWLRREEWEPDPASLAAIQAARRTSTVHDSSDGSAELAAELVGRETEFSQIIHAWSAVQTKGARIIQVVAESGFGKTRLGRDVLSRIRASRGKWRYIRANFGERAIPFSFASAVAESLAAVAGAGGVAPAAASTLVSLNPALSSRYSETAGTSEPLTPLRVGLALLEVIASIADENPIAIVLDDMHWCDSSSREAMTVVGSRLTTEKVLLITASRPQHGVPPLSANAVEMRLGALTETDVSALVTSLARLPEMAWARELPHELHATSAGVPLRVMEALRYCIDSGLLARSDEEWQSSNPAALHSALEKAASVERRISSLTPDDSSVLLLIGIAGMPVPRAIIVEAATMPESQARMTIADLEMRGLVTDEEGSLILAHDTIGDAIIAHASYEEIRTARRKLGNAFAASADFQWRKKSIPFLVAAERWRDAANHALPFLKGFASSTSELNGRLDSLLGAAANEENLNRVKRELPLTLRRPTLVRNIVLSVVPFLFVIVGFAIPRMQSRTHASGQELAMITESPGSGTEVRIAPLDLEHWNPDVQLRFGSPKKLRGWTTDIAGHATPRPGTESWAIYSIYPDSGAGEIDLVDLQGMRKRLTVSKGDDRPASFSPDGKKLLFITTRWNSNGWSDVAILDVASGSVSRVTRGDATYDRPTWSPDGTRIAYTREPLRRSESAVCVAGSDGLRARCNRAPGWTSFAHVGWLDKEHLLVHADSADQPNTWMTYNVETGLMTRAGYPRNYGVLLDPSGTWTMARPLPGGRPSFRIAPSHRFDLSLSVPVDSTSNTEIVFLAPGTSGSFLDSVSIGHRTNALTLGVPSQLTALGWSRNGKRIVPKQARWRSLTPAVATIDSLGVIVGSSPGMAIVEFSAGGWRTAIDTLKVEPSRVRTVLDERWDTHTWERWRSFGDPLPQVVRAGKVNALLNDGDGSFLSGAYLRQRLDPSRGIAMDLDVSTPLTQQQWQLITASFADNPDEARLRAWDHRTGYIAPYVSPAYNGCGYVFPSGEGEEAATSAPWFASLRIAMKDSSYRLDTGRWYHVRVQLFPNGRCGIAIDGKPLLITPAESTPKGPMILIVQGHSVNTRMLVGRLTVATGIPTDIDWTRLEFDGSKWVQPRDAGRPRG